jgi:hypothetical protein
MNKKQLIQYNSPIVLAPESIDKAQDFEDYVSLWMMSKELDQRNQWFKGDIADKVAIKFKEESLEKFSQSVGEKYDIVSAYRRVARAFPIEKRMYNASWTHYFQASFADKWNKSKQQFETDKRFGWLEKATDETWTVDKLRMQMAEDKANEDNDLYTFYLGAIVRFGNIITHWKKEKLDKSQREMLIQNLEGVVDDFEEYLNDNTKE